MRRLATNRVMVKGVIIWTHVQGCEQRGGVVQVMAAAGVVAAAAGVADEATCLSRSEINCTRTITRAQSETTIVKTVLRRKLAFCESVLIVSMRSLCTATYLARFC